MEVLINATILFGATSILVTWIIIKDGSDE